ncbi:lysozyme inhibitor Ivy, partial [Pseudomonas aeruginosa]
MNGVSRLLSLALLGAALHWAPAQAEEQPRLFELLGQPGYKATWHAMFKGESDVPKWVSDASGPSSPSTSLSLEGQPYVLANSCKPHDCGNNRLLVAFRGDKSAAYGLQVSLPDEPAEVM